MLNSWEPKQGFTFTELIIVISILAILSTIGFVYYSGSISETRDSKRELDLSLIQASLKSYKQEKWYYPFPWDYFNITYNWTIVAHQWILNQSVFLSTLDTIPIDPLTTKYYSYSITTDAKQFQIATTLENDWKPKTLLIWDYKSVTKNILPNIILATSTGAWVNIEISTWTTLWSQNRKLFLFNQSGNNFIYSLEWDYLPQSNWKEFSELLTQSESNDYWQKHDYTSCLEIQDAWRSIGPWEYQIRDPLWELVNIWCSMDSANTSVCHSSEHYYWWACIPNTRSCNIANGYAEETWNTSIPDWNPCTLISCNNWYAQIGNTCMIICTAWWEVPCVIQ